MGRLSRFFRVALLATITLALTSCGSSLSKKISIEGGENLKIMGLTAAKGDVTFRNNSGSNITLRSVRVTLKEKGKSIATLELGDEIFIPRRTDSVTISTVWRLREVNALAAVSASKHLLSGNGSFYVDLEADVKMGLFARHFEEDNIDVKQLMKSLNNK